MAGQDLRSFVDAYGRAHWQIRRGHPRDRAGLDRRGRDGARPRVRAPPPLPRSLFEKVAGLRTIPIVCNVVASRRALAFALGVDERALAAGVRPRIKEYVKPVVVPKAPFVPPGASRAGRRSREELPMPRYFPGDAGVTLTAGMLGLARDPTPAVETRATIASSSRVPIAWASASTSGACRKASERPSDRRRAGDAYRARSSLGLIRWVDATRPIRRPTWRLSPWRSGTLELEAW